MKLSPGVLLVSGTIFPVPGTAGGMNLSPGVLLVSGTIFPVPGKGPPGILDDPPVGLGPERIQSRVLAPDLPVPGVGKDPRPVLDGSNLSPAGTPVGCPDPGRSQSVVPVPAPGLRESAGNLDCLDPVLSQSGNPAPELLIPVEAGKFPRLALSRTDGSILKEEAGKVPADPERVTVPLPVLKLLGDPARGKVPLSVFRPGNMSLITDSALLLAGPDLCSVIPVDVIGRGLPTDG